MTETGKRERKENLKEFYGLLTAPIILAVIHSAFYRMSMAAFTGTYTIKPGLITVMDKSSKLLSFTFGFPFGLMCLLAYLWGRPAYKYAERPSEELKAVIRRRLANVYRDAFLMLFGVQALSLAVAALGSHGLAAAELAAAGVSLAAQSALLVVLLDSHLSKQKKLLPGLYTEEELTVLRPAFNIPVSVKISLAVFGFAVIPFALVYIAVFNQVDLRTLSGELTAMLAFSAVFLLNALLSIHKGVQLPLNSLIARMERVPAGDYGKSRIFFSDEVARLKAGFNSMIDGLREREARIGAAQEKASRLESELAVAKATSDLAAQVAHDIRSPLASLGAATRYLDMPAEQRRLVEDTVNRLKAISDDLLARYRAPGGAARSEAEVMGLAGLVEAVIAEKRLQYKDRPVRLEFTAPAERLTARVDGKELQRAVSNLVNNGVEAIESSGVVSVSLSRDDGEVALTVRDDGKGIPADLLPRLGRKGGTHGKPGGTGLGLYHARELAEGCGGRLSIESMPGEGTAVTLLLPALKEEAKSGLTVLLDDDLLVHMNWKAAAAQAGAALKAFTSPAEFRRALPGIPKDARIHLDSDLGGGVHGETIAQALREEGYSDISMETGHGPERFAHLPWLKVTGKEPPWA